MSALDRVLTRARVEGLEAELRIVLERERKLLEQTDTLERHLRDAREVLARILIVPSAGFCPWCDTIAKHASGHERDCPMFLAWQHQARAALEANS